MPWLSRLLSWFGFTEFVGPSIDFTFVITGGPMAAGTGTITLTASPSGPALSGMPGTITVGAGQPISFDALSGPFSFSCNEGDPIKVVARSVSKGGVDSAEVVTDFVAVDKTTVPGSPDIAFSFVVNPPAAS